MSEQESSNNPNEDLVNQLPRTKFWDAMDICNWEGFWFEPGLLRSALTFQKSFEAEDNDVLLASTIKTGTTWLKALCLCILEKNSGNNSSDILDRDNPHFQVSTIESLMYITKPSPDVYTQPSPRLFHTHLPYSVLPESIKNGKCKIVYISRNPKDTLISLWHFFNTIFRPNQEPYPLEKAVDMFCSGVQQYGPFYEHVLEYWLESRNRPEKILFLKYEDLQRDPKGQVKKLACFLGTDIEEGEVDQVLWRCSLGRLKNLDVNKSGSVVQSVPNSSYFRRGVVGDWKNYLTPEMEDRINDTNRLKLVVLVFILTLEINPWVSCLLNNKICVFPLVSLVLLM